MMLEPSMTRLQRLAILPLIIFAPLMAAQAQEWEGQLTEAEQGFATAMALAGTLADHCHRSTDPNETLLNEELAAIGSEPFDFNAPKPTPMLEHIIDLGEEMEVITTYITQDQACDSLNALFGPKGTILPGLVVRR